MRRSEEEIVKELHLARQKCSKCNHLPEDADIFHRFLGIARCIKRNEITHLLTSNLDESIDDYDGMRSVLNVLEEELGRMSDAFQYATFTSFQIPAGGDLDPASESLNYKFNTFVLFKNDQTKGKLVEHLSRLRSLRPLISHKIDTFNDEGEFAKKWWADIDESRFVGIAYPKHDSLGLRDDYEFICRQMEGAYSIIAKTFAFEETLKDGPEDVLEGLKAGFDEVFHSIAEKKKP